ncbi:50S ribosomal protein L13, partial [Candidatus Uhrbacteria bacterium CG_4_10_14_0_2_um_filter_41_7]
GKHKPTYQAHIDAGDVIVVENIAKVKITGKKLNQKQYYRHSGYPGGLTTKVMGAIFAEDPRKVLEFAVSRMLPKNKHRVERMNRLNIS